MSNTNNSDPDMFGGSRDQRRNQTDMVLDRPQPDEQPFLPSGYNDAPMEEPPNQQQMPDQYENQQQPQITFAGAKTTQLIVLLSKEGHEIKVPFKITQMCRKINAQYMKTPIVYKHLKIIVSYCEANHYSKTSTSLQFPLAMNNLQDNHYINNDWPFIKEYSEDFQQLKELMRAARFLGVEAIYQLCAASLASWFRRRTMRDVNQVLRLEKSGNFEPPQMSVQEIMLCKNKFSHFLEDIKYPQLTAYELMQSQVAMQQQNVSAQQIAYMQQQQARQNQRRAMQEQAQAQNHHTQYQQAHYPHQSIDGAVGNSDLIGREIHHRDREHRRDHQAKQEPSKKNVTASDTKKQEKKQKRQDSKDHNAAIPLKILPDVAVVPEKPDGGVVKDVEMEPELLIQESTTAQPDQKPMDE